MNSRPKIQIPLSGSDRLVEIVGILLLVGLWSFSLYCLAELPDTVPMHFNFSGEPDRYGSKKTILILPILGTLIYALLTFLCKFPHIFNYTVSITTENAARQYIIAIRTLRYLKISILLVFFLVVWTVYKFSTEKNPGTFAGFLPIVLALVLIPSIVGIVQSIRKR